MNSPRGERGCSQSSWGCRTLPPTLGSVFICFVSVSDRCSLCGSEMAPVVLSLYHSCSSWSYRQKENLPDWLSLGQKSAKVSWSSRSAPTQTKWIENIFFSFFWSGCRSWGGGEYDFPVKQKTSICPLYLSRHIFFFIHYAKMPTGNLSDIQAPRIGLIAMRKMKDKIPDLMNKGGRKFSQNGIQVTTSTKGPLQLWTWIWLSSVCLNLWDHDPECSHRFSNNGPRFLKAVIIESILFWGHS